MNTKNIQLVQYDSQEVSFSIDKSLLTATSKVFLQYKKEPLDSAICSLEITSGDLGNDWFPTIGNNATIQWNVQPEHTLTSISKITRFGYGLMAIDGTSRKTLSTGNILMFPSYNSPYLVKEYVGRMDKEIMYATYDNQSVFNTFITLSNELIVFVDGVQTESYSKTADTQITLIASVSIGTQIVIFSMNQSIQTSPLNTNETDMFDKSILIASADGQTSFSVVGFTLSSQENLIVFVDSVLTSAFTKTSDTTISLTAGVTSGTQVVILSPKTLTGTTLRPIENKQLNIGSSINVYAINPSVDTTGFFRYMENQILTAITDGQTDFEITDFTPSNNLIVFVNFMNTKDYTITGNTIVLNEGVSLGTSVIVYSVR